MRRILVAGAAFVGAATFTAAAPADAPFPSPQVKPVFVAAQVLTTEGAVSTYFAPGSTVVFRAYAVDTKTQKLILAKDAKYFYVAIPNAGNVKFSYSPTTPGATARMPWIAKWTIPASYPAGTVNFKVLVKTQSKRIGQFVQLPVATSQLTVQTSGASPTTTAPQAGASTTDSGKLVVSLYVDSVNGSRPAAAQPRPVGCTQTNVFRRGEQFVLRAWGTDVTSTDLLTNDNVSEAHASIPGVADLKLNWGPHGAASNRVFFWSAPWDIPTSYPLGQAVVHVTFTLESGKVGTYDYPITIIP